VDDRVLPRLQHVGPIPRRRAAAENHRTDHATRAAGLDVHPNGRRPTEEVRDGQIWYDRKTKRVETVFDNEIRVIRFSSDNLIANEYKLDAYIDLVVGMLITFGLSFQLPLVVLALVRTGHHQRQALKQSRHYIYFGIAVLSAAITPGDTITATVLLTFPLILLYELGIWLSREPKNTAVEEHS
jgi:hypothetical protein